ncbi:LPP20 family lipoprotein [Sulfurimonas sp. MAG313]|nr:LPP20 family lipoprotein [Sulfurimonas sp. MAG313]MDF1880160.1 LPP20 family lipoprotein [Sulfurimonas sp. MAG313]
MTKAFILSALLSSLLMADEFSMDTQDTANSNTMSCPHTMQCNHTQEQQSSYKKIRISVTGQGVAPTMTSSPAQAYALAKRAAIADAYRLLAEKLKGVRIEGSDKIKNMMVMRSEIRTFVDAVIAEAEIIETVFKDGLCEVEMELTLDPRQWQSILASR